MKKDGTKQLNTDGNEFVEDIEEWIETQTGQGNRNDLRRVRLQELHRHRRAERQELRPVSPDDRHLPAVPRAGGQAPHPAVGQGGGDRRVPSTTPTSPSMTFNAALLNAMAKVQRLKAPEGWPVLAPYAAILLDDETLKTIQKDGDINAGGQAAARSPRRAEARRRGAGGTARRPLRRHPPGQPGGRDDGRLEGVLLGRDRQVGADRPPASTPSTTPSATRRTRRTRPSSPRWTTWRPASGPGRGPTPSPVTTRRSGRPHRYAKLQVKKDGRCWRNWRTRSGPWARSWRTSAT